MEQRDILKEIYEAAVISGDSLNELRQRFGGQAVYLRQAVARTSRERIIADAHRMSVRACAAQHGVSKSTASRLRKLG